MIRSKIQSAFPARAELGYERIVSIEDQCHVIVKSALYDVVDPIRMTVSRHLVAIEIGDYQISRMKELERSSHVSFIRLEQDRFAPDLSAQSRII